MKGLLVAASGFPLRVSQAEPGSVHDLTAARIHALAALYQAAAPGLLTLTGRVAACHHRQAGPQVARGQDEGRTDQGQ